MSQLAVRTLVGIDEALDAANGGLNFSLKTFKLGNGFNYTPTENDVNIHGALQAQGDITDVIKVGNSLRFLVNLPITLGTFEFGEIGLYSEEGTLHYLMVWDKLQQKRATSGANPGNILTIKVIVDFSPNGSNVEIAFFVAEVAKLGEVQQFNDLMPASNPITNAYIVGQASQSERTVAYASENSDLWRFSNYMMSAPSKTVSAVGAGTLTIPSTLLIDIVDPGDIIFQVTSGPAKGLVRSVLTHTPSGGNTVITYDDSMPDLNVGNTIEIHTNMNAWTIAQLVALGGAYVPLSFMAAPNGVATLGADSKVPTTQLTDATAAVKGIVQRADATAMTAETSTTLVPAVKVIADWANAKYLLASAKGANNGVAGLDGSGVLSASQIPPSTIQRPYLVADQAAMLALSANLGDVAIRTDTNETYMLGIAGASTLANWFKLRSPTPNYPVLSVNGATGTVVLTPGDLGAVPSSRNIGTAGGSHLSGGGNLSADRNLAVDMGTLVPALDATFVNHTEFPTLLGTYNTTTVIPERTTAIETALIAFREAWGNRSGVFSVPSTPTNYSSSVNFATPFPEGSTANVVLTWASNFNGGDESDECFWVTSVTRTGFTYTVTGDRHAGNVRYIAVRET